MRIKRIVLLRAGKKVRIVAEARAERGQTPAVAVIDVPDGDVVRVLRTRGAQDKLGLRQKPTRAI